MLADLTLESLPVERSHILVLGTWRLLLLLSENPGLEALEMDESHGSSALAGDNQRVGLIILVAPTDSALNLVLGSVIDILSALYFHGFSQLLVVELLL